MADAVVCPLPPSLTYKHVKDAFDKARKATPHLTPAAWRKAAAQELGIDYPTYLKLWKSKGKDAMISESTPTLKAAESPGPTMDLAEPKPPQTPVTPDAPPKVTTQGISKALDDAGFPKKGAPAPAKVTHKGELVQSGGVQTGYKVQKPSWSGGDHSILWYGPDKDKVVQALKDAGYDAEPVFGSWIKVKGVKVPTPKPDLIKEEAKVEWKLDTTSTPFDQVNQVLDAVKTGKIQDEQAIHELTDISTKFPSSIIQQEVSDAIDSLLPDVVAESPTVTPASNVVMTNMGPLDHDLARMVYKKMLKEMPGATPATVRKASAEFLNVDYKTYLDAWKKPATVANKAKQATAATMPTAEPILKAGVGKYSKVTPTKQTIVDDLASVYGPQANKQYISVFEHDGVFDTVMPSSILTPAQMETVAKELQSLGLEVTKTGQKLQLTTKSAKEAAAKREAERATGFFTDRNGNVVWDHSHASEVGRKWYSSLNEAEKKAVKAYTGSEYTAMNRYLRKGGPISDTNLRNIKNLRTALEKYKQPQEHTVYRGATIPLEEFVPGEAWGDDGFISTSPSVDSAWTGVQFHITVPKGAPGMYVDPVSSNRGEQEFLIQAGTSFLVQSVDKTTRTSRGVGIVHLIMMVE